MADSVLVRLQGVDEMVRALQGAPQKIRIKAVRRALTLAARVIRDDAKARRILDEAKGRDPLLQVPARVRSRGTVRKAIAVRPSKFARQGGDEGVFVGVRPLRGRARVARYGKAGARNRNDPFYWRFLEFGTRKMGKRPFLGPAARAKGEAAIERFMREVVPAIDKLNRPGA